MSKRFIDPQACGDCWEEECHGCEIFRNAARFDNGEYPDDDEETESEEGEV